MGSNHRASDLIRGRCRRLPAIYVPPQGNSLTAALPRPYNQRHARRRLGPPVDAARHEGRGVPV